MWHYIIFLVIYFICLLGLFMIIQRPLFIYANRRFAKTTIRARDIWEMTERGIRTDKIAGSYLVAVPVIAATVQAFVPVFYMPVFMTIYNLMIAIPLGLLIVTDLILYRFWEYKIDSSVLPYLRELNGAVASVSTRFLFLAMAAVAAAIMVIFAFLQSVCLATLSPYAADGWIGGIAYIAVALIMLGGAFIMIRGLGRRPNNPSLASYSKHQFFNHSALNPLYNFIYSLSVNDKIKGAFHEFDDDTCHREFEMLFPRKSDDVERLLNTDRPNVLFIIWESLSARFVEELGGTPGVMPHFGRLSDEGVLFTHVDANSFRTDRALPALLSGYLAQPTTTVIRMGKKLPNLPAMPRRFREAGYETMAVHGGDTTVFHMSEYFFTVGHDHLVTDGDFAGNMPKGKWGVHDGAVMEWLYDDIMEKTRLNKRWYTSFLTLSSHEPWDVPYKRLVDDEVANSFAYVDEAFGNFVDRLKASPAWKDLLIIVVGDHGCNGGIQIERSRYAHIPLMLLGGAVKKPRRIDKFMTQSDIAATLLGQLGLPHDEFIFSRDVMSSSYIYPFSFHTYNNGFMFRDGSGYTVYDNISSTALENPDDERERKGKIILQYLYEDLESR